MTTTTGTMAKSRPWRSGRRRWVRSVVMPQASHQPPKVRRLLHPRRSFTVPLLRALGGACNPNTTVVRGMAYFQCGSAWYTQAYDNSGVVYTPVPAPY
ncbi:MAG TPA: hypothetical protein VIF10_00330 [Methylobacter sp.]